MTYRIVRDSEEQGAGKFTYIRLCANISTEVLAAAYPENAHRITTNNGSGDRST